MQLIDNKHIHHFNPLSNDKTKDNQTLYHYTSPIGLHEMLNSGRIRFTDCEFLNDKSEFVQILKPFEKAVKTLSNELHPQVYKSLSLYNDTSYQENSIIAFTDEKGKIEAPGLKQRRSYIFCTSKSPDDLVMWNYYVKDRNYQGYNLSFNVNKLIECFNNIKDPYVEMFAGKVIYKETEQIELLTSFIKQVDTTYGNELKYATDEAKFNGIMARIKGEIIGYIMQYRLFFKSEKFSHEKEYRFIIKMPVDHLNSDYDISIQTGFSVIRGIFVPHCDLLFNQAKSFIKSITMSPMLEAQLAKNGLERFLIQNGYGNEIKVVESEIPIRY